MKTSIHREIFRLAIPNIVSNISVPLISSVDTLLMGQISSRHLGAIGLGGILFSFLYWNMGFLRMSTTGGVAQAYGSGDRARQKKLLTMGLLLALGMGVLFIILQKWIGIAGLWAFAVHPDQQELVMEYVHIRIWGAPAVLALMVMMGYFFGMQNAWYPLWITLIINIVNIFLSILLVQNYDMSIRGVALGTVAAQYIGLGASILFFLYKYFASLRVGIRILDMDRAILWDFVRVNRDIFLRTFLLCLVFGFVYRVSSSMGITLLAINTVIFQFINWMSYGLDGFAYAAESLVGRFRGAGRQEELNRTVAWSFGWSALLAACIGLLYGIYYSPLFAVFSEDEVVVSLALEFRVWVCLMPLIGFASYIWDGIFIGLLAAREMLISMGASAIVFFGLFFLVQSRFPSHGIWIAFAAFLVTRAIVQWHLYLHRNLGEIPSETSTAAY